MLQTLTDSITVAAKLGCKYSSFSGGFSITKQILYDIYTNKYYRDFQNTL